MPTEATSREITGIEAGVRDLAEALPHLVWITAADGAVLYFNQRWADYTGLPLEDSRAWGWQPAVHPDDIETLLRKWRQAIATGTPLENEHRIRRAADGAYRWHLVRGVPRRNELGEVAGWFGTCTDVHDQKFSAEAMRRAEQSLRDQRELTQTIADNAASCLFMMDREGHPTFMNPAARQVTGYESLDEIRGRPLHHALHSKKPDGSAYPIEECPIDSAQSELRQVRNREEVFCRKDGTLFPVSFSVTPLEKDGQVTGSVLEFRDITEEKRIREELQDNLKKFDTVVHHLSEGMIFADDRGAITYMNPEALRIHGFANLAEMLDLIDGYPSLFTLRSPDGEELPFERWPFRRVLNGERFSDFELEMHRADTNRKLIASYGGTPVFDEDGRLLLVVLTIRDVTEKKSTELALREAVRARDEFLSIASHELRTPLTGMRIQTQMFERLLSRGDRSVLTEERVSKLLHQVDKGITRLVRLVEDMLDISRIQTGRLSMNFETQDLAEIIDETLERLRPELEHAGIEARTRLERGLAVRADRFRLEQVLTNLVTNAIRYAHHAPLEVTLERGGRGARLSFRDHGPGIAPGDQERVFQRFERLVRPEQVSGFGLGLYISKQIIEGHSGTIRAQSDSGQGADFVIELPLA